MTDDKGKAKAEDKADEAEEPTYHVDRLVAEAEDFFGHPPHVVAGALDGERKQNFTRDEVKSRIEKWLKSEVKG